jgi:exodeoxyribonuclease V alpha subunit
LIRVRAGISYALAEATDKGHCGLPFEELVPLTEKLLEVPAELVETALNLELEGGAVVATISKAAVASSLLHFTEPSGKSPRS